MKWIFLMSIRECPVFHSLQKTESDETALRARDLPTVSHDGGGRSEILRKLSGGAFTSRRLENRKRNFPAQLERPISILLGSDTGLNPNLWSAAIHPATFIHGRRRANNLGSVPGRRLGLLAARPRSRNTQNLSPSIWSHVHVHSLQPR